MEKYTKDKLIDELLNHNKEVVRHMANIAGALENINDSNLLHSNAINANTKEIQNMATANNSTLRLLRWVLVTLVLAIVVLAGAEKVISIIPIIK